MSWARIDDQIAFHPKVVEAGNEAFGVWVRMLALSCAQLTDGVITDAVAATFLSEKSPPSVRKESEKSPRNGRERSALRGQETPLDALVRVRLLERIVGGYRIHDFHQWNPPASEVRAKREADRIRKAKGRANQGRSSNGRLSSDRPGPVLVPVRSDTFRTSTGPVPVPVPVAPDPSDPPLPVPVPVPPATAARPVPEELASRTGSELERRILERLWANEDLQADRPPPDWARSARQIAGHAFGGRASPSRLLAALDRALLLLANLRASAPLEQPRGGVGFLLGKIPALVPPGALEADEARYESRPPSGARLAVASSSAARDERIIAEAASRPKRDMDY